jgi:hypothetical protein
MTEEEKKESPAADQPIPWVSVPDGVEDVYANYVQLNWTLYDVRMRFGQIIPHPQDPPERARWAVLESVAVAVPWGQAKLLRDLLSQVIQKYEEINGPIVIPKLPT